jgi:FKBP-type peptidyl-prolyl cis-trans isomerase FklB
MHAARGVVAAVALGIVGAGCGRERVELATLADSASYAIGMNLGMSVHEIWSELNEDVVFAALREQANGQPERLGRFEGMLAVGEIWTRVQEAFDARARGNMVAGRAYMEENGRREGVTTTSTGLQYEVIEPGSGPVPEPDDSVRVHFRGTLVDGTEFESTLDGDPEVLALWEAIPGWVEVLQVMSVGAKYRVVIPPSLAYLRQAPSRIGPDATLIFEIELLEIVR